MSLPIASFKLRIFDEHVRVVPAREGAGCPFEGAGIDLRGADARAIFALAGALLDRIADADADADADDEGEGEKERAREAAASIRSVSIDRTNRRILVTFAASPRPRVLRFDGAAADPLLALAVPIEEALGEAAARILAAR